MKKLLIAAGFGLAMVASAQAASEVAVLNIEQVFQQMVKTSGVDKLIDNEFKGRASELQKMEADLQSKIQKLQQEGSKMKAADRSKMEKAVNTELQSFNTKKQQYEHDHGQRVGEERGKLLSRIDTVVKKVAAAEKIDVVLDAGQVVYKSNAVKDISADVLKQVK